MRSQAFGVESADSLLTSVEVARASLATLVSGQTGHIVDIRREDPLAAPVSEQGDDQGGLDVPGVDPGA